MKFLWELNCLNKVGQSKEMGLRCKIFHRNRTWNICY